MKDDPTMCMKTQDRATKCPSENAFFDQTGAILTSLGTVVEPCGGNDLLHSPMFQTGQASTRRGGLECGSSSKRGPTKQVYGRCAEKKILKKYVRSRNVYENKGTQDTMPEKKHTFRSQFSTFTPNRALFCRKLLPCNDELPDQFGF
jgi:hypothetical protein